MTIRSISPTTASCPCQSSPVIIQGYRYHHLSRIRISNIGKGYKFGDCRSRIRIIIILVLILFYFLSIAFYRPPHLGLQLAREKGGFPVLYTTTIYTITALRCEESYVRSCMLAELELGAFPYIDPAAGAEWASREVRFRISVRRPCEGIEATTIYWGFAPSSHCT